MERRGGSPAPRRLLWSQRRRGHAGRPRRRHRRLQRLQGHSGLRHAAPFRGLQEQDLDGAAAPQHGRRPDTVREVGEGRGDADPLR